MVVIICKSLTGEVEKFTKAGEIQSPILLATRTSVFPQRILTKQKKEA